MAYGGCGMMGVYMSLYKTLSLFVSYLWKMIMRRFTWQFSKNRPHYTFPPCRAVARTIACIYVRMGMKTMRMTSTITCFRHTLIVRATSPKRGLQAAFTDFHHCFSHRLPSSDTDFARLPPTTPFHELCCPDDTGSVDGFGSDRSAAGCACRCHTSMHIIVRCFR